jgi:hypothetical protein
MKNKFFYSHLVETSEISLKLGKMNLSNDEKVHLAGLIEANIHSEIVAGVLSELSEEDKKTFLKDLISENHEKTWEHLNKKINKMEEKIKTIIINTKAEFLKDIVAAQKLAKKDKS